MGTKQELVHHVEPILGRTKHGLLLDAFAGMGAIASSAHPGRPVWTNDVQRFCQLVDSCLFTSVSTPPTAHFLATAAEDLFSAHLSTLKLKYASLFEASRAAICSSNSSDMNARRLEGEQLRAEIRKVPYSCFLSSYSNSYFSVEQAAEIDAIRFSLDHCLKVKLISASQFDWALMSLGRAMLKVANTPGHFAQFLRISPTSYRRVQRQWRRSVWTQWLISVEYIRPVGTISWRKTNRATCVDSLELLLGHSMPLPIISAVYCDPPYTDDQYSRFYHVWETLVLYDNPSLQGTGRYREDRFVTPFSKKTTVAAAFETLVGAVKRLGADLVLSYPSNGLLYETGNDPMEILGSHFPRAEVALSAAHRHSTFGASKGPAKATVREIVYLAKQ